jgi:diadenosine tetraphosphate (Ap4A) HIT family hydrolase
MSPALSCPLCQPDPARVLHQTGMAQALFDSYPVSEGHALVVPRCHVASLYELNAVEVSAVWRLVSQVRELLQDLFHPDGFNIGVNDGEAAGQTVMHAHVHVVPRYKGDVADPRGGIRWVIPAKAAYWK